MNGFTEFINKYGKILWEIYCCAGILEEIDFEDFAMEIFVECLPD